MQISNREKRLAHTGNRRQSLQQAPCLIATSIAFLSCFSLQQQKWQGAGGEEQLGRGAGRNGNGTKAYKGITSSRRYR
jgi:hypothetical protein